MKHISFFLLASLAGCFSQRDAIEAGIATRIQDEPDVTYTTCHDMSFANARVAAESLARSLQKYGVEWTWDNSEIVFKVTGGPLSNIHGLLLLTPTTVGIEIYDLPDFIPHFIVRPRVESKINSQFHHSGCHHSGGAQ